MISLISEEGRDPLVYIKQIELRGFKSFGPKKITLKLNPGLMVFTGPNGSGKSNIFDAVKFVLGDLSARSLRASKMAEVIFDGVTGAPPSKSAYVKIRLDNSDRKIPIDRDYVILSRRVNRQGFSKYALNGRVVSRSHIVSLLSMAGVYSSGYNMIMQGTITKLAEITPEERRKVIENFVGISEYNAKKAEARVQLHQAETNLRIADARIGDVQSRLENLEEERNDALRYNFIKEEIRNLQAVLTSHSLSELDQMKTRLKERYQQKSSEVQDSKEKQDRLRRRRGEIESARRDFDKQVVDQGSIQLIKVQRQIGEVMANITSFKAEIESGKLGLKRLSKLHTDRKEQLESLNSKIQESRHRLSSLRAERKKVNREVNEKSAKYSEMSERYTRVRQQSEENLVKLQEIDVEFRQLEKQSAELDTQLRTTEVKDRFLSTNLQNLEERRDNFELNLKDLENHFTNLQVLHKEEQETITKLATSIDKSSDTKDDLFLEMEEAQNTARLAKNAVAEFKLQKDIVEKVAIEDSAIQLIEEMGEAGAIPGIYGQLQNLIKVNNKYRKALTAAASGWLKAVVVQDMITAIKCVESLKKMKLGRIKLIPMNEVKTRQRTPPRINGVIGVAIDFIRCNRQFHDIVNFVFGDTIVTGGEKSAFLVSKAGFRAVDLNGNLYEAGGGIESGYYRAPIELTSLLPSGTALEGLSKSVESLERILSKSKLELNSIDQNILQLHEEQVKRVNLLTIITKDLEVVSKNITRTKQSLQSLNRRVTRIQKSVDAEKEEQKQLVTTKKLYTASLKKIRAQKRRREKKIDRSILSEYQDSQTSLDAELNELNTHFLTIKNEIHLLESSLEANIKPEQVRIRRDIRNLSRQIERLHTGVEEAQLTLKTANEQMLKLEKSKETLSNSLVTINEKRTEFEKQLDELDFQLTQVNREYEPLSADIHKLDLEFQRIDLESSNLKNELQSLGYEKALLYDPKEIKSIESSLDLMRFEFEQLGSINQLAPQQYNEQQIKYKQLSIRRNQLENERKSIIDFMDEIERRKREAFIDAYSDVNKSFSYFFEKLTGGGRGWLNLQNPDDPFAGGLDIFVQFPGKSSRLIASASGGEKSVVAVAFIFAIQQLSPASFYLFDEIDAHLDHYNAERLADLLREQSTESQFIVITLRDVVLDRAEKLFGVYIQNELSQLVTPQIEKVMA